MKKAICLSVMTAAAAAWCGLGWLLAGRSSGAAQMTRGAERIVSLTPDVTEILFAMGLGQRVVGVSTFCDYPPEAAAVPKVGTYWEPDMEAVISRRPDLVVGERSSKSDVLQRLSRMGCRTAALRMDSVADVTAAIDALAELTGQRQQAELLKESIKTRLARVSAAVAGRPRPRVLWVVQAEPLRVAGRETFVNELIELAGGQNAIGPTAMAYPPVGIEQVLGAGVEAIIQPAMAGARPLAQQRADALLWWSRWPVIPAVRSGSIYVIPADVVSRLSPRLADGAEMIARLLHPDCFADSDAVRSDM
jgi:iron complex transport system substrate-binding protein